MNADISKAVVALFEISKQYPTEELRLTIRDGTLVVGFPRSELGDKAFAAWQAAAPGYVVGMS